MSSERFVELSDGTVRDNASDRIFKSNKDMVKQLNTMQSLLDKYMVHLGKQDKRIRELEDKLECEE